MKFSSLSKKLSQLIQTTGEVAGQLTEKGCATVAQHTGIQELGVMGRMAGRGTAHTGKILGELVGSAGQAVEGVLAQDNPQVQQGLGRMGRVTAEAAQGMGRGIMTVGGLVGQAAQAQWQGDAATAQQALKKLALVGGAAMLGVGLMEGADLLEADAVAPTVPDELAALHDVEPHTVEGYVRADGTVVDSYWRDGDSDASTHLTAADGGGYLQTNPDDRLDNNLNAVRTP